MSGKFHLGWLTKSMHVHQESESSSSRMSESLASRQLPVRHMPGSAPARFCPLGPDSRGHPQHKNEVEAWGSRSSLASGAAK